MPTILLLEPLHPEAEALLAEGAVLRRGLDSDPSGSAAIITRGLGRITAAQLEAARGTLRCVARVGAGTENVDVPAASALGIPVLFTPDAFTAATAEHALALLLALTRGIPTLNSAARDGRWLSARTAPQTMGLAGKRLGIIGLGRIGRHFGTLAQCLGMEVVAWSRTMRDGRFAQTDLPILLATSDVVSLHLSLEPETRGFLNAERIARLKAGAIVLNVARGALLDEGALAQALQSGRLRGAALDVLAQEPPPPDHPLLALPNVLVTPHTAALTDDAFREASLQVAAAVCACLAGNLPDPGLLRNPQVLHR